MQTVANNIYNISYGPLASGRGLRISCSVNEDRHCIYPRGSRAPIHRHCPGWPVILVWCQRVYLRGRKSWLVCGRARDAWSVRLAVTAAAVGARWRAKLMVPVSHYGCILILK